MSENFDILLSDLQINFIGFLYERMDDKIGNDFSLNFNSIQLICDGCGWIKVDGKTYCPEKGYINLLPANTTQSYGPIDNNYIRKYICHFYADIGSQNLFDLIQFSPSVKVNDYKLALQIFYQLESIFEKEDIISILKKKQLILQLITIWLESQTEKPKFKRLEDSLTIKFAEYVNQNINKNITVADAATQMGYNTNYFTGLFKSYTKLTPKQYIINVKLKKAMTLLADRSLTIAEIAEQTGFVNQYYFSTSFKKNFGLSPSKYREIVLTNSEFTV